MCEPTHSLFSVTCLNQSFRSFSPREFMQHHRLLRWALKGCRARAPSGLLGLLPFLPAVKLQHQECFIIRSRTLCVDNQCAPLLFALHHLLGHSSSTVCFFCFLSASFFHLAHKSQMILKEHPWKGGNSCASCAFTL